MPFISREELPAALKAAYDKAAKGVENDETRLNLKNDEKKIDSLKELLLFAKDVEVNKDSIDGTSYKYITQEIAKTVEQIKNIKKVRQQNIVAEKNNSKIYEARAKFEKYEDEHPVKSVLSLMMNFFTLGLGRMIPTDYNKLKDEAMITIAGPDFGLQVIETIDENIW